MGRASRSMLSDIERGAKIPTVLVCERRVRQARSAH
jgi:hypothetical protein